MTKANNKKPLILVSNDDGVFDSITIKTYPGTWIDVNSGIFGGKT